MTITNDIRYIGVNDHEVDLFEGQYVVPNGMSYNSYAIMDEKVAIMDTVDQNFTAQWMENIEAVLEGGYDKEITDYVDESGIVAKVYSGAKGYAVEVTPGGFDNTITMMVGVDTEGKVLGISVISHTETAGLGAVAAAGTPAGEAFRGQFAGMSGALSVTKDGGEVQAITGATITSRAICVGVNAALDCVANMG